MNGTFFLVTEDPAAVPELKHIISTGIGIQNGLDEAAKRLPTDKEIRIIDPETAKRLFGVQAERLDGVTVSVHTQLLLYHCSKTPHAATCQ